MFDWLGTFNKSQLDSLLTYVRGQAYLIPTRISHLEAEKQRIGIPVFKHQANGAIVGFTAEPVNSYVAKLLKAYLVLGGDPYRDLDVRLRTDPVFRPAGTEVNQAQIMSNGDVIGGAVLADAPSAELIRQLRTWSNDDLDWRRDRIERKIRRALDYYDELQLEVELLQTIQQGKEVQGSLEYIANILTAMIQNPNYRAIYDDKGQDPTGKLSHAPFSSYEAREDGAEEIQRGDNGVVLRGSR